MHEPGDGPHEAQGAWWKHTTGDEVLQLRALQLSDRWAPAVQRATKPLAKPVQIARGLVAAFAKYRTQAEGCGSSTVTSSQR